MYSEISYFINVARYKKEFKIHLRVKGKGKGKAIPLQAWTGPEGSRRLRLPDFMTIGAYESGKAVSLTHRPPLRPGNIPATHFC